MQASGDSNVFYYVLGALFIVGLGFSLQQTAANPFAISLGEPEKGAHRLNLAGGIILGTTIGPIVVALILFGSTPKSGAELNEMINNGSMLINNSNVVLMCWWIVSCSRCIILLFKKITSSKDDSEFLKAPKALSALLIMTILLAVCFYFIFDQYKGVPNDEVILNYTILSLIIVVGTL